MRSEATFKNSIWGIASQAVACVLSMFSRKVMIDTIGVEGVGLNAFLTSVIAMLSLTELGIGTAIVYHMYAPLAKNDTDKVKKLMNFYKTVYKVIAAAIMLIGLALLPFMGKIVGDVSYSQGYVSLIFLLFLLQTTTSYLFTYKRSLLSADQKQYIITAFDLLYKIASVILGVAVLYLTRELAYYLVLLTVLTLLENIFISKKADKLYPYIKGSREKLEKDSQKQIAKDVKNIFVGKVSGIITNSTDSILINLLAGTVQTGLYSNYNIILATLTATVNQLSAAMKGSIGNLVASESANHIDKVFKRLIFIMFFAGSFCAGCLTGLIDPFIGIVFGKELILDRVIVYICIFNVYMTAVDIPVWSMVASAGLFKYDKYISITGSGINLIVSYILGTKIGMAGILFGTSCTYVIQFTLKIMLFYKKFLKLSCVKIFIKSVCFLCAAAAECALIAYITNSINIPNQYVQFLVFALVSAAIPPIAGCVLFFKTDEFIYSINLFKNMIKRFCAK